MFGSSSPFGQSASSPFGSQPAFGQNNATNNPFGSTPFATSNPFGSPTGSAIFGSTSTGVFGQSSSPLSSTPTFGAAASPGFGSSTPAFGSTSSSFGGSSAFGQKPFGSFGSGTQPSPFGSSLQQSQPAFGSSVFGSSQAAFGTSSQPSFGGTSTPAFGSSSMPSFGATSTPAFGATASPSFGNTSAPFGGASTTAFGSGGGFGSSNPSMFSAGSNAFGGANTPAFGANTNTTFGASSASTFGGSSSPAFGGASTPAFSFSSSQPFAQSMPTFGSTGFGSTPSPFSTQPPAPGAQTTAAGFGSGGLGQSNSGGTRIAPYAATVETDGSGTSTQPAGKLESISAMPQYKEKSHEELRWEDYQRGDKGGPNPAGQSTPGTGFPAMSSPFSASGFGQSSSSVFSSPAQPNPFATKPPSAFGSSTPAFSSAFASASTPSLFGSSAAATSSPFGTSTPFGSNTTSIFGSTSAASGGSSLFGTTGGLGTTAFGTSSNFGNSQSSPLFQSSPSLGAGSTFGQTNTAFGQTNTAFGQTNPAFGQTNPAFGQTNPAFGQTNTAFGQTNPAFGQTNTAFGQTNPAFGQQGSSFNMFNPSSTGLGAFSSPSLTTGNLSIFGQSTPSLSTPFQPSQPTQSNNLFNFNNNSQMQPGAGPGIFGQSSANQNPAVLQPVAVSNPFGTLPAMPHMSIGNTGTSSSIQYGISSIPVVDKPMPVRVSSLLTSRHLSQRRIRLPARKYHPSKDGSRVPFFSDDDEAPSTPKADALFIPRENPRALFIRPIDQWSKASIKEASVVVHENGKTPEENEHHLNGYVTGNNSISNGNGSLKEKGHPVKIGQNSSGSRDDTSNQKGDSYITLSGHRAGEAAIVYEHGADIEAMMPKLRHSDYFTEPRIQELAAKERAEPGFCRHVKDFVVGRYNFGSIKFLGETDVRRLDLESLIQFNNREVIVYMDDSKKPPVGQGLNKPAEVTLLNIKCHDKKTGTQILEGPRIEKYKQMLKKKAEDQGAEFLSYDPAKGEWKFRVHHFSKYVLNDDDQWDTD